ncbi:MAG TPA: hypothetical protein VHX39_02750, partial [Acetobacteraceae bacterium]|nr:hypothetical protein [Acetobacteraceae bacterium]
MEFDRSYCLHDNDNLGLTLADGKLLLALVQQITAGGRQVFAAVAKADTGNEAANSRLVSHRHADAARNAACQRIVNGRSCMH